MEAQYAPEAQQLQDPATLTHAQEAVAPEDPVKMGPIQITGVMMLTAGPALTTGTGTGLFPTARSCVDNARFLSPQLDEEVKSLKSDTRFQISIIKIKSDT